MRDIIFLGLSLIICMKLHSQEFRAHVDFHHPIYYNTPAIEYDKHYGTIYLNDGGKLRGCVIMGIKKIEYYVHRDGFPQIIKGKEIQKIVLRGVHEKVKYRTDSTEFFWSDQYDIFIRKLYSGRVELFDNLYYIDEIREGTHPISLHDKYMYQYLPGCKTFIKDGDSKLREIKCISDLSGSFYKQTAYLAGLSAIISSEVKTDPYLIAFLFGLFSGHYNINDLGWSEAKIFLKDKSMLNGYFLIHPLYIKRTSSGGSLEYVHLYNENCFKLIEHNQIDSIVSDGHTYYVKYYNAHLRNVFTRKCVLLDNDYYLIYKDSDRNGFLFNNENMKDYVFAKATKNGKLRKAGGQNKLRKAFN